MASQALHNALLRPAIIQILRAAGFNALRPSVLDALTELSSRYMVLLASKSVEWALNNHDDTIPNLSDVRLGLQEMGAFRPSMSFMEELYHGEEDTRGVDAFISWFSGPEYREILRIAGFIQQDGAMEIEGAERQDYLQALKKKHSKTGEESRYQGTLLGKSADEQPIPIEGDEIQSIDAWIEAQCHKGNTELTQPDTPSSGISSVPDSLTEPGDLDIDAER